MSKGAKLSFHKIFIDAAKEKEMITIATKTKLKEYGGRYAPSLSISCLLYYSIISKSK